MNKKTQIDNLIDRFPESALPGLAFLTELALDLSWCWNHAADEIWEKLDMSLWELTHNQWIVLQTVSFDRIKDLLADPAILSKPDTLQSSKPSQSNSVDEHLYQAGVDLARDERDYTVRIIPNYKAVSIPLEGNLILWQR